MRCRYRGAFAVVAGWRSHRRLSKNSSLVRSTNVASLLAGNSIHRSRLGGFRIKKTKISRTISSLMNKSTLQRSLFFLAIFACIQLPIAAMGQPAARSNYEAINAKQFLADRKITISNPKDTAYSRLIKYSGSSL